MNTHDRFTERSDQTRLVVGWTALIASFIAVWFHPPTGLGLLAFGGSVIGANWYAQIQDRTSRDVVPTRAGPKIHDGRGRLDQAREYRDLFEEGIISLDEYHEAVASLYPEINRLRKQRPKPTKPA